MLTIWDSAAGPSPSEGESIYTWTGHADRDSARSLLRYVEIHEHRLRHKYLGWIHDLGESVIDGKRLVEQLAFDDGLSYWWLTLLAEKSPYRSPIIDAIRLLAIEEIIAAERPQRFRLVSARRDLDETLRELCMAAGIAYEWQRLADPRSPRLSLRRIYDALPQRLQATAALLRYLLARWPFRKVGQPDWSGGPNAVFFGSYFESLDREAAEQGKFQTQLWGDLHALLARLGRQPNWLHLYIPSAPGVTPQWAIASVLRFNRRRNEQGRHSFLDAFLSWRLVGRVVKRWLWLCAAAANLRRIKDAFRPRGTLLSLWPLLKCDWQASMCGAAAINNLLSIELFDAACRSLPRQAKGIYLCENIAWERAFVHAWRKYGHGQLIGAAVHATIRFWDLRYFPDPRSIRSDEPYALPRPDRIALNGQAAIDALLAADFPPEQIVECEVLRYGSLKGPHCGRQPRQVARDPLKVLVLGDYLASDTTKALRMLEAAALQPALRADFSVKPHPNCMVRVEDYRSLDLKVVGGSLSQILPDFDIAYSSNKTSAALDAYLAGLPVVVALDDAEPNFSPLQGRPGVRFVGSPEELKSALEAAAREPASIGSYRDFFFIDPDLPRWNRLLSS